MRRIPDFLFLLKGKVANLINFNIIMRQSNKKKVFTVFFAVFLLNGAGSSARGEELVIDDFSKGLSPRWEEKIFAGKTVYTVADEDGMTCLRASSNAAASGLFYAIKFDPRTYPVLSWSWKIDDIITAGDALTKAGDDYAARIYVVFPSFFFINTKALNYIWANKLPQHTVVPNPFSGNDMMIAVESGRQNTGRWVFESRNIYEDYKKIFGKEPPDVGAIAIMTDTDNTGERATACYGTISIKSLPR